MILQLPNLQPSPLTPWGTFRGQRRLSDSPYIESIWEGTAYKAGAHLTAADGTIDLTLQKRQGLTRLILSGPTSRAKVVNFEANDEVLTIRLRTGVYLPFKAGTKLVDVDAFLPNANNQRFWLNGSSITFPRFDNVEIFTERLARAGLLRRDIVVEDVLKNRPRRIHIRTIQRHFLEVTGLTMAHIRQIKRAEQARSLLASDSTLTSIAYEAGYSNPGHMTNAFKYFFGQTPTTLRVLMTQ